MWGSLGRSARSSWLASCLVGSKPVEACTQRAVEQPCQTILMYNHAIPGNAPAEVHKSSQLQGCFHGRPEKKSLGGPVVVAGGRAGSRRDRYTSPNRFVQAFSRCLQRQLQAVPWLRGGWLWTGDPDQITWKAVKALLGPFHKLISLFYVPAGPGGRGCASMRPVSQLVLASLLLLASLGSVRATRNFSCPKYDDDFADDDNVAVLPSQAAAIPGASNVNKAGDYSQGRNALFAVKVRPPNLVSHSILECS
jgi:hypothetical protein